MIRGTNKRIIEINGEEGSCFERIVLFLRPGENETQEEQTRKLAENYADGIFRTQAPVTMLAPPRHTWTKAVNPYIVGAVLALLASGLTALCFVLL